MFRCKIGLGSLVLLGLVCAPVLIAQEAALPTGDGQKWAVVVGIDGYLDPAIPKLQYAVADARLIAQCLVERCGYGADRVGLLTDDQTQVQRQPWNAVIGKAIRACQDKAGPRDTVLVYFSGHGFIVDGKAYLAPWDCRKQQLAKTGLATADLRDALLRCRAAKKLLVLDCCHAGSVRSSEPVGPSSEELGEVFTKAKGLLTLASCRRDEVSQEWHQQKHGLFTYFLAQALGGAADFDHDRIVDSDELYKYVYDKVPKAARTELGVVQTPVRIIGEDAEGVFALAHVLRPPVARQGNVLANSIDMRLALIPAGRFVMGSPKSGEDSDEDESPHHAVQIVKPFYFSVYEVTQQQYERVTGKTPSRFSRVGERKDQVAGLDTGRFPVEGVSWSDAGRFCRELSRLPHERRAGRVYRLPTEAEWEYACRAGTTTLFHCGDGLSPAQANIHASSSPREAAKASPLGRTTTVGSYAANAFGLYDMHGNVAEWCEDWYDKDYYSQSPPIDPRGPNGGTLAVLRGGAWNDEGPFCRSAKRFHLPPADSDANVGFRVVCEIRP